MEAYSKITYKGLEDKTLGMAYYIYERNVIWRVFINCKHIRTVYIFTIFKSSERTKYIVYI